MDFDIERIFIPSTGVDLVFNMNSLDPISRSSIIHDTNFKKETITIAQPLIPITPSTSCKQLHLTTILHNKKQNTRVGIECQLVEFDNRYLLANQKVSKAVILKYKLPVTETNIRSAFRLPLSRNHTIKAKIIYKHTDYSTAGDFSIRDISLTGMGLTVKKKKIPVANPLSGLKAADIIPMGMILIDIEKEDEKIVGTFTLKTKVKRVNKNYSESHILVGLEIIGLGQKNETMLNSFIHNAQIDELNRLSFRKN